MGTPATPTTTKLASSNMGPVSAHTMRQLVDRLNGGWVLCPCSHGHVFPSVQAPATHQLCTCSVCTLSGHRPSHGPQRTDPDRYFTSGKLAHSFSTWHPHILGMPLGLSFPMHCLPPPPLHILPAPPRAAFLRGLSPFAAFFGVHPFFLCGTLNRVFFFENRLVIRGHALFLFLGFFFRAVAAAPRIMGPRQEWVVGNLRGPARGLR